MSSETFPSSSNKKISCLVEFKDPHQELFYISVEDAVYVYELKEKIKKANPFALADVDATSLILWKVNISFDDEAKLEILNNASADLCEFDIEKDLYEFDIEKDLGGQKLDGLTKCQHLTFSGDLNIIVKRPFGRYSREDVTALVEEMQDLNIKNIKTTYPKKTLTLNLARRMGSLKDGYQVEYHGKIAKVGGKYLVINGTKVSNFSDFIKAADPKNTYVNDDHLKDIKINGVEYHEYRARVFLIHKASLGQRPETENKVKPFY